MESIELIVGSDDCSIETVASILDDDKVIRESWSKLPSKMGIPSHRIIKFREDLLLDKITHADLIREILELWRGHSGRHASLSALIGFVEEVGAVNVAESLKLLNVQEPSIRNAMLENELKRTKEKHAEVLNESNGQIKALQNELIETNSKVLEFKRKIEQNAISSERQAHELKQLTRDYEKLFQEKLEQTKILEEELANLRSHARGNQRDLESNKSIIDCQLNEIKCLKEELAKVFLEKQKSDDTAVKLQKENADLRDKNDQIEKELKRTKTTTSRNENGETNLHIAVDRGDEHFIKELIQMGADLNARNNQLETPLIRVAKGSSGGDGDKAIGLRMIKCLIEGGCDVYAKDMEGQTFLHALLRKGNTLNPNQFHDIAASLCSKNHSQIFVTPAGAEKVTPINLAVEHVNVELKTLTLLHKHGVCFDVGDFHKNSVLYYSLKGRKDANFLYELVRLGADWEVENKYRQILLHSAAEYCHLEGIRGFLHLGLDVNASDIYLQTPLHWAVERSKENQFEIVQILIANGADVKDKDKDGCTPMDLAMALTDEFPDKKRVVRLLRESQNCR